MNSILQYIADYRKSNPSGWRKWIFGTIVALLVLFVVVVFSVREVLRQQELSRLKHAHDLLEEEIHTAEVQAALARLDLDKERHTAVAEQAKQEATVLSTQIETLEAANRSSSEIINSLRSWSDVDANVR